MLNSFSAVSPAASASSSGGEREYPGVHQTGAIRRTAFANPCAENIDADVIRQLARNIRRSRARQTCMRPASSRSARCMAASHENLSIRNRTMAASCAAGCALVATLLALAASHAAAYPQDYAGQELLDEVRQLLSLASGNANAQQPLRSHRHVTEIDDGDHEIKPDRPREVKNWPRTPLKLGQVAAVSVNSDLQPVIFHRVDRVWDQYSFNSTHHYQHGYLGPIKEPTVLTLDPTTGKVLGQWGANLFYMPHGLTLDRHDNLWVTDVALQQAFKFRPGELQPSLTFGEAFQPGASQRHLCKPTAIAIANTGEIFIADGYCNNRILKYNAAGGLLRVIPSPPEFLSLQVPHALALIESMDRLCVADRENMRVTCPRAGLYSVQGKREPALTIQQPDMGRVFGVAARGNLIYAVNGPTSPLLPVQGFTIDPQTESVIDHWAPEKGFGNPHALAICPNNSAMYVVEIGPNRVWKFDLVRPGKK